MIEFDIAMNLRKVIGREEFDYPALMSALGEFRNPRAKVSSLLRKGDIIRVKKGLYVFGEDLRRRPHSLEVLANLVYGPSFLSMEYALAYHGLIPERVATLTSVTPKRCRRFLTPVGTFVYRQVPKESYPLGMDRVAHGDVAFLIAVPERALADKLRDDRGVPLATQKEVAAYLFDDLRISRSDFVRLDHEMMDALATASRSRKIARCAGLLRRLKGRGGGR